MPRFQVRVEYALAFDLDLEVEGDDEDAAVEEADRALGEAGIWSAIRGQFGPYRPEIANGTIDVTDVVVLRSDEDAERNAS